MTGAQKLMRSK